MSEAFLRFVRADLAPDRTLGTRWMRAGRRGHKIHVAGLRFLPRDVEKARSSRPEPGFRAVERPDLRSRDGVH